MSELELAIAGLLTLLGAGAILFAGTARPGAGRSEDAATARGGAPSDAEQRPASPSSGMGEGT